MTVSEVPVRSDQPRRHLRAKLGLESEIHYPFAPFGPLPAGGFLERFSMTHRLIAKTTDGLVNIKAKIEKSWILIFT